MAAMRFAGMELGAPPAPKGLCADSICFLFDESGPGRDRYWCNTA
jgi:hypothetical protein